MINTEKLPRVEKEELARILDLPRANRFPTENDISFLKARMFYLTPTEIRQFKLNAPVVAPVAKPTEEVGVADEVKLPQKPKKVAKKAIKITPKNVKKVFGKAIKSLEKKAIIKKRKKAK